MKRFYNGVTKLFLMATLTGAISAYAAPTQIQDGILTDASGMTLYVFDRDVINSGKSVCNGMCAENWPPMQAAEDAKAEGDYSIVKRDDGKMQWAYKGKPLYLWAKDKKPGDKNGDGVNNVWHVAKP